MRHTHTLFLSLSSSLCLVGVGSMATKEKQTTYSSASGNRISLVSLIFSITVVVILYHYFTMMVNGSVRPPPLCSYRLKSYPAVVRK